MWSGHGRYRPLCMCGHFCNISYLKSRALLCFSIISWESRPESIDMSQLPIQASREEQSTKIPPRQDLIAKKPVPPQKQEPASPYQAWIGHNEAKVRPISQAVENGRAPSCVYVLESVPFADIPRRATYVGESSDVAQRLSEHNLGERSSYTRPNRPHRVGAVISGLENRSIARDLEKSVKGRFLTRKIKGKPRRSRFPLITLDFPPGWTAAQKKVHRLQAYFPFARKVQKGDVFIDVFLPMPENASDVKQTIEWRKDEKLRIR